VLFKIRGTVEQKISQSLIISLGPVSFKVRVPLSLLSQKKKGDKVDLYTYLYVRENELEVFGFDSLEQQTLFSLFIDISGIGPKSALGILSQASVSEIKEAVEKNYTHVFTSVPGIGKKNAGRIILELKSKFGKEKDFDLSQLEEDPETKQVVEALVSLGYAKREAKEAIRKIGTDLSVQDKIRECLKILGR